MFGAGTRRREDDVEVFELRVARTSGFGSSVVGAPTVVAMRRTRVVRKANSMVAVRVVFADWLGGWWWVSRL